MTLSWGVKLPRPLTTTVFWHPSPRHDGGPQVATNHVGLAPVQPEVAHSDALKVSGYPPAQKMLQHTLTFDQPLDPDPARALATIDQLYHNCTRCHLCDTRNIVVTWRGDPYSPICFMGEGPGKDEDQIGQPFVGKSGTLQNVLVDAFGLDPHSIFWMNVVGCRPARPWDKDRAPTTPELVSCSERTFLMLRAVRPRVIISLGKVATRLFFAAKEAPPVWSFTQFTPPHDPESWVMFGHAYHPAYLSRVMGGPKVYGPTFGAARTFYSILKERSQGLTKPERWPYLPRYLADFTQTLETEPPWEMPREELLDRVAAPELRDLQEA